MNLKIFWVGKTKNASIRELSTDYLQRLRRWVSCEVVEIRDLSKGRGLLGARLVEAEGAEITRSLADGCKVVALDGTGRQFSSLEFARWLEAEQNRGTREIAFVIGGPEGLGTVILDRANLRLSLSRMTWTHEMCRVLLLEQVYRAYSILRHIPYHK